MLFPPLHHLLTSISDPASLCHLQVPYYCVGTLWIISLWSSLN
jgi:hypothetical protein